MVTSDTWTRFLDDAGPVPDDRAGPHPAPWVGDRVVRDEDLPRVRQHSGPLRVSLTGGAAQIAGPSAYCRRQGVTLSALDTTLRDLDDPAGNARRVVAALDAARAEGDLADDVVVHVRLPGQPTAAWLAAADVLAQAELVLCLPLDAGDPEARIDAAMDRELEVSLSGGTVEQAVAAVASAARLWGDPGQLDRGRRWVRCWATEDVEAAVAHLAALR